MTLIFIFLQPQFNIFVFVYWNLKKQKQKKQKQQKNVFLMLWITACKGFKQAAHSSFDQELFQASYLVICVKCNRSVKTFASYEPSEIIC